MNKKEYNKLWCKEHPEYMRANAKKYYQQNTYSKKRDTVIRRLLRGETTVKKSTLEKYDLLNFSVKKDDKNAT